MLYADCKEFAIGRKMETGEADLRIFAEVGRFAAIGRNFIDLVLLIAAGVLLVKNPLPIGRPYRVKLPVVRLHQLNGPSSVSIHLPQILPSRQIGCEDNLFSIGRPRGPMTSLLNSKSSIGIGAAEGLGVDAIDCGSVIGGWIVAT